MGDPRVKTIVDERTRRLTEDARLRNYRRTHPGYTGPAVAPRDGEWKGQPCFIVGGGPSLKGFDFERLYGAGKIIAVNKSFRDVPFADIVFFMDHDFYTDVTRGDYGADALADWKAFQGRKVFLNLGAYRVDDRVTEIPAAGQYGLSASIGHGLYHGNNSGAGAIALAYCMGANPIYLLGFDSHPAATGETHYHEGYGKPLAESAYVQFTDAAREMAPRLKEAGAMVINLNPESAIRSYEFGDIDEALPLRLTGKDKGYIVVSYYTRRTGYAKEIRTLEASLTKHDLPYHLFSFEPAGTWRANLNFKSECILKAFDLFPGKDIVFLDADAIVRRPPVLFDELSAKRAFDLSAHFFKYDPKSGDADELLSGTLWIQGNATGRRLVEAWNAIGLQRPNVRHQMCLKLAVAEMEKAGTPVRVYRHPFAYTCIYDYQKARGVVPVVEHFQASRRLRREVGYGVNLIKAQAVKA